jgi:hypothetical protein
VRACIVPILIASVSLLSAADDPGAGAPHTDVRKELLSEFKFVPPQKEVARPAPFLTASAQPVATSAAETGNGELVTLAPFTVREMVRMETLHADILQEKADARTAAVMSKLGIGLHVAPVGPVAFYAATLFYIPFAAGFAISF